MERTSHDVWAGHCDYTVTCCSQHWCRCRYLSTTRHICQHDAVPSFEILPHACCWTSLHDEFHLCLVLICTFVSCIFLPCCISRTNITPLSLNASHKPGYSSIGANVIILLLTALFLSDRNQNLFHCTGFSPKPRANNSQLGSSFQIYSRLNYHWLNKLQIGDTVDVAVALIKWQWDLRWTNIDVWQK